MSYSRIFEQRIMEVSETQIKFPAEFLKEKSGEPEESEEASKASPEVPKGPIDMHLHFVDFLQRTDGMQALLREMNNANIARTVVFGLPVKKKWEFFEPDMPQYYLDDNSKCYYYALADQIVAEHYMQLSPAEQKRIAPTLCGFNPTDKCAIYYIEEMFKKFPIWKGIGELLLRHDDLTNLTLEETARVNHPALYEVFEFCAEKGLPVNVHQNSTSVGTHDRFEYLHEMMGVLESHPDTTIVWAHCGASRRVTGKKYWEMIDLTLDNYPNLHVDISWVVYDDIICKENSKVPKEKWVKLIEKHSSRFMIGSDLCGHFDKLGQTMARYNELIKLLPADVAKKLLWENAEKLWFE